MFYVDLDNTLRFNFLAAGGAELFGFCSSKSMTKLMFSCVKTVAFLLALFALKTFPQFSNLVMTQENLLPISLQNISSVILKCLTIFLSEFIYWFLRA